MLSQVQYTQAIEAYSAIGGRDCYCDIVTSLNRKKIPQLARVVSLAASMFLLLI